MRKQQKMTAILFPDRPKKNQQTKLLKKLCAEIFLHSLKSVKEGLEWR
jgi:hypothetical protein